MLDDAVIDAVWLRRILLAISDDYTTFTKIYEENARFEEVCLYLIISRF